MANDGEVFIVHCREEQDGTFLQPDDQIGYEDDGGRFIDRSIESIVE
jgi:hypothetical protein